MELLRYEQLNENTKFFWFLWILGGGGRMWNWVMAPPVLLLLAFANSFTYYYLCENCTYWYCIFKSDVFITVNCTLYLNCLEEVCVDLEHIQCLLNLAVLCCDILYIVLLTVLAGPVHCCHGTFIPAAVYWLQLSPCIYVVHWHAFCLVLLPLQRILQTNLPKEEESQCRKGNNSKGMLRRV